MGQAATKASEARAQRKSKPKTTRGVQQQKLRAARGTGLLALPDCKLRAVPSEVLADADLARQLRSLDLSRNRIDELPAAMGQLTALRTLKLASNALTSLPDLSALTALTTVRLGLCASALASSHLVIGSLTPLASLFIVQLVLDGNAIASLPHALPPNLTKLSLRGNRLQQVPPAVLALSRLQELDLAGNAIATLPDGVARLSELQELTIDENALADLPAALAKCGKLKVLSARANRLAGKQTKEQPQAIALELLRDSGVHVMNLEGNPLTKADLEAMDGFDAFLHRRTQLKHKEIHGGLQSDLSVCGLD